MYIYFHVKYIYTQTHARARTHAFTLMMLLFDVKKTWKNICILKHGINCMYLSYAHTHAIIVISSQDATPFIQNQAVRGKLIEYDHPCRCRHRRYKTFLWRPFNDTIDNIYIILCLMDFICLRRKIICMKPFIIIIPRQIFLIYFCPKYKSTV